MSWLLDAFAGFELPADLLTKLRDFEAQYDVLQKQNVALKLEVEKLRTEVAELRKTKPLIQSDTLDTEKVAILILLAHSDEALEAEDVMRLLAQQGVSIKRVVVDYHLVALANSNFVGINQFWTGQNSSFYIKQ